MIEIEELDRVWRDGLARLAPAQTPLPDPVPAVARRARHRRRRPLLAGAIAVAAAATVVVAIAATSAGEHGAPRPAVEPPAARVVVRVVDAPAGALTIDVPGYRVEGATLHVVLPSGHLRFEITTLYPGHSLQLEGVHAFAPVDTTGTATRDVDLSPGLYRMFCAIPGHSEAGEEMLFDVR